MPNFSIVFLLAPLFVCFFWSLVFFLPPTTAEKKVLAYFMFTSFIAFLNQALFFSNQFDSMYYFHVFFYFFPYAQLPALFLYIYRLTNKSIPLKIIIYHHIFPFIIAIITFYYIYILLNKEQVFHFYNVVFKGHLPNDSLMRIVYIFDMSVRNCFILFGFYYFWLINFKIKKSERKAPEFYADDETNKLQWIKVINVVIFIFSAWSILLFNFKDKHFISNYKIGLYIGCSIMTILYMVIGFYGNKQESFLYAISETDETESNKPLSPEHRIAILNKIKLIMREKKPFLNPYLSLPELAKIVGTNRSYLSVVLNEELHQNFNQFINIMRIIESTKLISAMAINKQSLKEISEISGFSSYSSFYRWFKTVHNISPDDYLKQVLKIN
jgi:AraC-like DNA-binding protein